MTNIQTDATPDTQYLTTRLRHATLQSCHLAHYTIFIRIRIKVRVGVEVRIRFRFWDKKFWQHFRLSTCIVSEGVLYTEVGVSCCKVGMTCQLQKPTKTLLVQCAVN